MKATLVLALLFSGATLLSGCSSVGPHPDMTVLPSEVKATHRINKILVTPTTGTGTGDPGNSLNKTVPAAAFERYGDSMLLASGFNNVLDTLGMSKDLTPILTVNWQLAFYRWIQAGKEKAKTDKDAKRPKSDMQIEPPPAGKRVARTDDDLAKLSLALKRHKKTYDLLTAAEEKGEASELDKAEAGAHRQMTPLENLLRHIMRRLSVTYLLVSDLEGDKDSFDDGELVTLQAALINVKTGKFRYYARSAGKKTDLAPTYDELVSIMAHNMFEDLADVDKIEL